MSPLITLNGGTVDAAAGTTVADLVAASCPSPAGVAVLAAGTGGTGFGV